MEITKSVKSVRYAELGEVAPDSFLPLLNSQRVRAHLIEHPLYNRDAVRRWLSHKIEMNAVPGCRVKAVLFNNNLAGWCGIQREAGRFEVAIVLDDQYWGAGPRVFSKVMEWASEFGHETVDLHLLDTRPEYRFLNKLAKSVKTSELTGNRFVTYEIRVMDVPLRADQQ